MNYCETQFGKPLDDLLFQDIENYFVEERTESDQLEFKSITGTGSIKEKISVLKRSICAFLNSSGGLLIWGAPKGQNISGKNEKVFKGQLTVFSNTIEKDLLISSISDGIIPLPNTIRCKILESGNQSIVVFEIDVSDYSPHQTGNTYYMRIDGQNKPAPHHYIEALFKKIKYPNIESVFKINRVGVDPESGNYKMIFQIFFFNWSPLQNEEKLSFRVIADGVFEGSQNYHVVVMQYALDGHEFFKENAKDLFYYGEPIVESQVLLIDPGELQKNDSKTRITVSFAGRFSPRKSSEYILDFSKRNNENINEMIVFRKENRLAKDIHAEKGMDKEKIIAALMKLGS